MDKMRIVNLSITAIFLLVITSCSSSKKESKDTTVVPKQEVSRKTNQLTPLEQGLSFAMQTKAILGENLLNAIDTRGVENAVSFCSAKAYPLTDSMATRLNAKIKRVSDKNRNPNNKADKDELTYIAGAKDMLGKGEKIKPQINERDGKIIGYYPIVTGELCMQCHGEVGTEIASSTYARIKSLYPKDKAVGYGVNELRGIWVVEMDDDGAN